MNMKQLIFEERRRCCGQGAFLFTASLVLTVAKSALVGYATTSYYATDSIDFRAEPGINSDFTLGFSQLYRRVVFLVRSVRIYRVGTICIILKGQIHLLLVMRYISFYRCRHGYGGIIHAE